MAFIGVDIFAPSAFGTGLYDETNPHIQAKAICELAYNQLAEDRQSAAPCDAGNELIKESRSKIWLNPS